MSDPDGFGRDLACMPDLTWMMDEVEGVELLTQDLVHRMETPRGRLLDDPEYGKDAAELVSEGFDASDLAAAPRSLELELVKDERVSAIRSTVTQIVGAEGVALEARFDGATATGPFHFTADISKAGVLVKETRS